MKLSFIEIDGGAAVPILRRKNEFGVAVQENREVRVRASSGRRFFTGGTQTFNSLVFTFLLLGSIMFCNR